MGMVHPVNMTNGTNSEYRLRLPRKRHLNSTGRLVAAVCVVMSSLAAIGYLRLSSQSLGRPGRVGTANQVPGSIAAPSASSITSSCQMPTPAQELGPRPVLPGNPFRKVILPQGGFDEMSVSATGIYTVGASGVDVYSMTGRLLDRFALPARLMAHKPTDFSQPVVDPSGHIFLSSRTGGWVAELSAHGSLLRTFPIRGEPTNIFALQSGSASKTFELGVSTTTLVSSSLVFDEGGHYMGHVAFRAATSGWLTNGVAHQMVYSDGKGFVQVWDSSGKTMEFRFGSQVLSGIDSYTGGPFSFDVAGEAAAGPHGTIYAVNGPNALTVTSADGILKTVTSLGGSLGGSTSATGALFEQNGNLYLQTGQVGDSSKDSISVLALTTLRKFAAAPRTLNTLGWGAGLRAAAAGNYFPPGTSPTLSAVFDPWWSRIWGHLALKLSIWNVSQISGGIPPIPQTVDLGRSKFSTNVTLPVPLLDAAPGPYELEGELVDTSVVPPSLLGTACMPFSVGAPGDRLNLNSLSTGVGAGGPSASRGVQLNSQLGLSGFRPDSPIGLSQFLTHCGPARPSSSTCGPQAMTFGSAPLGYFRAAAIAASRGVTFWIQVSGGGQLGRMLAAHGWWGPDVEKLVTFYSASPPAGCLVCAPVTRWEPWNEPNSTGFSNATNYVSEVLKPFYAAVKRADVEDTVLGGSTLGVPIAWWTALVAAGGLSYMDVATVHPYTGNNDSWAEDGTQVQLAQLQRLVSPKPLWISELGWWSDGPYDFLAQADNVAQAMVAQKALDIPVWNYFFDEGSWGNDGVSFSLIQTSGRGDDYVKPAALATMTASSELSGSTFEGNSATGIPYVYQANFARPSPSRGNLAVVWTGGTADVESLTVSGPASSASTVPIVVTNEYGRSTSYRLRTSVSYRFAVSQSVTYVLSPRGYHLALESTEPFGPNLALSSSGATATASSSGPGNPAAAAIAGTAASAGYGQGWMPASGDTHPYLTVRLAKPAEINRVLVDSQSEGSTAAGLRNYAIQVLNPKGNWIQVAQVRQEFRDHVDELAFDPVVTRSIRVVITAANYGGYAGGGVPSFWPIGQAQSPLLHSLQVYSGSLNPTAVGGGALSSLPVA